MNKGKQLDAQVSIATGFRRRYARESSQNASLLVPPPEYVTSLTTYTTHADVSDTRKKKYIYIVRTRGKAIIGMALRAIKRNVLVAYIETRTNN